MYREINGPRVPWTDEQKLSIGLSGGNVLVSASAGSGKTAVLTERLLQRIIDRDDPADIREFVVVTFTKAAAAEMKARLGKKLNDFLREHPERSGVKCQLMHVTEANISTIDSFCLSLLEKYQSSPDSGYVPGVKIASEGEAKLLFKKAVNDALEEEFGKGEAGFYALIDAMSDRSGGTGSVKAAVERLHFILDISPERDRVKEKMTKAFSGDGIDTASLFAAVFENTAAAAAYHEKRLNGLIANAHSTEEDAKLAAHIEYIKKCAELARSIRSAAEARDYAGCGELLEVVGGKPRKPDNTLFAWYTARADVLGAFEGFIKNAAKEFSYTEEALEAEFAELGAIAERLFALTENAEARYADMKTDRGLWDYSDLETRALKLLWKRGEDGKLHRTSVSLEEGARYREILIDEYQDVNGVQDLIFRGICSESGNNVFMVGDVKQSIYGFRGATPKLFIEKRNEYHAATPEDAEFPAKISLNANFRSRSAVTSAVNAVFDAVMTVESCGIDYAEDRLNSGVAERDNPCSGAYFTLLRGKREDEGRYVAAKIKEILGSGMLVADDRDKTLRPVRPGDVAILLRSKQQNHVRPYADALTAAGVPFAAPDSSASFAVPSVRKMISVLRAIDNPMKDIDLAAAMISGVFGFNESELVRIRKAKSGVLYYAVKAAADAGNEKAADFIVKLEHYRRRAAALTAEKLIWYIYKTTGLLAFVSSMKGGKREKEALLRFCDSARAYGASGRQDLSGFVAYINRLIEEDVKTAGGSSYGTGNEVRIMTIHQSKGLEFPVCFVCDTASEFNERELDNPFIIEPDRIGMKIARPLEHKRLETAARSLAAKSARGKSRMEEMRVLYVAMTRAAERLEVVASVKDPDKLRESCELRLDAGGRMDAYSIRSAKSFLDWVAPVAFCADGAFNVSVEPEYETPESSPEGRDVPEADGVLADKIYERINSSYGHSASAAIPTKLTVSDIVAAKAGREEGDRCCERRPACLDPSGRGGTEAGTATHAFLQFADFSKLDDPEAELRRLVDMRFITEKQAELIDRRKIANFASSDIFRRIRASEKVTREFRFTFEAVASDYIESAPDEKLLVQGAIDCYFVEGGKCVIVDYKTDRIRNDLDEKAAYYRPQLEIYARGLKELTGLDVSEAVLYFLDADKEVRVI